MIIKEVKRDPGGKLQVGDVILKELEPMRGYGPGWSFYRYLEESSYTGKHIYGKNALEEQMTLATKVSGECDTVWIVRLPKKREDKRVHFRCSGGQIAACHAKNPVLFATDPQFPFKAHVTEGVTCEACKRSKTYRYYAR